MDDSSKQVAKNSFRLRNRPTTETVRLVARRLSRCLLHVCPMLRVRNRLTTKIIASPEITGDATDWRQIAAKN
jgi:hypothetical protein